MFGFLFGYIVNLFYQFFLSGYVSGNYAFPKPLGAQEEREYLRRCKAGDEEARGKLIEHNLRLVAHIVKKYAPTAGNDSDDLISIGTIGLIKAIDSFDETKKIRLATYAARCIQNEILMVMRAGKNRQRETSLQDPIGTDSEGNTISLLNVIYSDDEDIDDSLVLKSQVNKLYEAIERRLSPREKKVLKMRYGLGDCEPATQREIAKLLNISRSYVSRIETKALGKLKGEIGDTEF